MPKIRDRIYLYAAVPGAYHTPGYALPGVNKMEPAEACRQLGLNKAVMDVTLRGPYYPFDPESEKLSFLDELIWTVIPSGSVHRNEEGCFDMEEIIRQIQRFPNVGGVFCDDFGVRRRSICPPERIRHMKECITASTPRKQEMWMVVYNYDLLGTDTPLVHPIWPYLPIVDVMSFWTWQSFHLKVLREHLDYLTGKIPGKKLNLGVYLWDFSQGKPLSDEFMQMQLDVVLERFRAGKLDSISLCSNCIMGIGLETEDTFRRWLDKYGDEEIEGQILTAGETVKDNDRV